MIAGVHGFENSLLVTGVPEGMVEKVTPLVARIRNGYGVGQWPTLVIEAGYSQSLAGLHADMRWWFSTSNHDVKIVILAKLDRRQHEIILERWEEDAAPARLGATTTRRAARAAGLQPVLRQRITISRNEATDPVSYDVSRRALVLRFELLFLRNPGPQEEDIIIGIPELQHYAMMVWDIG
ncbi:hypothetical protein DL768_010882 [Monosporascus sp. mg162]|nr:hypothetical protein DL768_010882 [Monosporascus sp. mg162]